MPDAVASSDHWRSAFARALLAEDPHADCAPEIAALVAQAGFAVYRNTVTKACIDALRANHPAVAMLVGDAWFDAAATIHLRSDPPRSPVLLDYGAGFADFLAKFPPAGAMPWLADVARLDRLWSAAHVAADAPPVDPARVAALDPERLASAVLRPHVAARWAWFPDAPVAAIWRRNRDADDAAAVDLSDLDWAGDGVLLVRPRDRVDALALDAAGCAFLDACARGDPLGAAAEAALDADPCVDLAGLMARLLGAGAFGSLSTPSRAGEPT